MQLNSNKKNEKKTSKTERQSGNPLAAMEMQLTFFRGNWISKRAITITITSCKGIADKTNLQADVSIILLHFKHLRPLQATLVRVRVPSYICECVFVLVCLCTLYAHVCVYGKIIKNWKTPKHFIT